MQSPPFPSQLVWDDDFVMVELVSIFSEEICVGLAAGAWCDESEIIFAGKEDILKSLVACYRTRSFLSRVSSVFVGIVKASN